MKRDRIRQVVIHDAENANLSEICGRLGAFHVQVIERRLNQLNLTTEQKIAVIDKIIENMKSRESGGVIR